MKLRGLTLFVGLAGVPQLAAAGGLLLPGAGAISTSRAGAAVASAEGGEAIVLNPAGIAKSTGHTITISAAMINYAMEFQRRGVYDGVAGEAYPFEGQPYALVKNDVTGIQSFQPVPVIAFTTDLGGRVPGLHLGLGLYAPNAYPFRDMCTQLTTGCEKYVFNDNFDIPPPSARYDIMQQKALLFLPSLVVAYRILPALDVGLRLTVGQSQVESTNYLWGTVGPSYDENPRADGVFTVKATDTFVPAFGLGVAYRPTPNIEVGLAYASELDTHAKGTARSLLGPSAGVPGFDVQIVPVDDEDARCAPGGTSSDDLKACVDLAIPMNLQIGGRYKFLDAAGKLKGDVELDLSWENWGKSCSDDDLFNGACTSPSDFRVVVDATTVVVPPIGPTLPGPSLNDAVVRHGLKDTYAVRFGGSYHLPIGAPRDDGDTNRLIIRGGLGYDTAAARTGWLRADLDGAARTTLTAGAAYRARRFEVSVGGGAILEGSPSNPNSGGGAEPCNPTGAMPNCGSGEREPADRDGPDPINPILTADNQAENPVAQGDYKARYLLLMLGVTTWF